MESVGGQRRFENIPLNIPKRRYIVAKFGTSVDDGKTQLFLVQIFDICPQKFLRPLKCSLPLRPKGSKTSNGH